MGLVRTGQGGKKTFDLLQPPEDKMEEVLRVLAEALDVTSAKKKKDIQDKMAKREVNESFSMQDFMKWADFLKKAIKDNAQG